MAERQNRIRSYCYGTAVTTQRKIATVTAQRNFSHKQRNPYGTYVILKELRNGNGETATAELQRNGGNQALETNCAFCVHVVVDAKGLRG